LKVPPALIPFKNKRYSGSSVAYTGNPRIVKEENMKNVFKLPSSDLALEKNNNTQQI